VPTSGLLAETITEAHIAPYAQLSKANYGDVAVADPEHLRWKFLRNPQGAARGVHLLEDGQLIGRLVAMPRQFAIAGRPYRLAYMVDLLIHPDHRGIGTLAKLMRMLPQLLKGFDAYAVTPNAQGIVVWETFAKLRPRFDLGVSVVPLRPAQLAARAFFSKASALAPGIDLPWRLMSQGAASLALSRSITLDDSWPGNVELDGMLESQEAGFAAGVRDRAFLEWRFKNSPLFRYDIAFIRQDGRLAGYIVTRRTTYEGYDVSFVVDAAGAGLDAKHWAACARRLLQRSAGATGPEMLLLLGNEKCGPLQHLARTPFVPIPKRYLPQAVPLFAEWTQHGGDPFTAGSLQFSLADCDMF
jgi:GNAT superfamily N-acetyltransferase